MYRSTPKNCNQGTGGWSEFSHYYTIDSMQGLESITIDQSPATRKVIHEGHLFIENNGKTYNAQGQQIH